MYSITLTSHKTTNQEEDWSAPVAFVCWIGMVVCILVAQLLEI